MFVNENNSDSLSSFWRNAGQYFGTVVDGLTGLLIPYVLLLRPSAFKLLDTSYPIPNNA